MCQARFRFISPSVLSGSESDLFKRVGPAMVTPGVKDKTKKRGMGWGKRG